MNDQDAEDRHGSRQPTWVRVAVMAAAGLITAVAVGLAGFWADAPSAGWAVACAVYVTWTWTTIARMDGDSTRRHASREDPSRPASDTLLLIAAIASLAALVLLLSQASQAHSAAQLLALGGVLTVALSWALIHTIYTLRYAELYYGAPASKRPIDFNQDEPPTYVDFAYLAFTLGMTYQVSDTDLRSSPMRSVVLRHMLISYLFGAVILASAINAVVSVGS